MNRQRTGLSRGTLTALGVAIALVLAIASGAALELQRFRESSNLVRRTLEVLTQADDVLRHLIDAETGHRGFLLTGDERYLEPYQAASQALAVDLDRLRNSLAEDPGQGARLQELEPRRA